MPEEQETSTPQMPSLSGDDGQSPGKMKVRDVLAQSGQLSSMFGQGQKQGQGMGDVSQGMTDVTSGVTQGASKFSNMMGSAVTDIAGGGGGETDIGEQVEGMAKEMAQVAVEVTKQVIETGVQAVKMAVGAAVGMPGVGTGGGMSMGGGVGGVGGGGGGMMGLGNLVGGGDGDGLGDLGGKSGGEADAGIKDVIRMIAGKDDKEHKLTVRQATGLSLPQQGMGIEGPKQGIKMK
ncbi:hypothetical protein [Roseimicrobium sp. ORNL1]|uniref:hypothetical protein n=1 Tax=Roseimicrobium sp. ORNL1 TaxID=2711231 RepID=UPI0013E13CC1|nr:hypothetical protein [Roseimicrobium sp. ORNL1]QIF03734.1 hypothetical protein G5S37_20150 [Roseimicrobium sp. ORNL1]